MIIVEVHQLRGRRQFAVQQVGDLDERGFSASCSIGYPRYRSTLVTVDIGDGAVTACGGNEAGIIGTNLAIVQAADINRIRTFGSGEDIQIDRFAVSLKVRVAFLSDPDLLALKAGRRRPATQPDLLRLLELLHRNEAFFQCSTAVFPQIKSYGAGFIRWMSARTLAADSPEHALSSSLRSRSTTCDRP